MKHCCTCQFIPSVLNKWKSTKNVFKLWHWVYYDLWCISMDSLLLTTEFCICLFLFEKLLFIVCVTIDMKWMLFSISLCPHNLIAIVCPRPFVFIIVFVLFYAIGINCEKIHVKEWHLYCIKLHLWSTAVMVKRGMHCLKMFEKIHNFITSIMVSFSAYGGFFLSNILSCVLLPSNRKHTSHDQF